MSQEFKPGDRLAAELLAERYSVSPTPVREAFARLAGEGLVTQLQQRGVRVSEISVRDMEEIYELRMILEPLAIKQAVAARTDLWASRLEELFEGMISTGGARLECLNASEYATYEKVHTEFHRETMSRCPSAWMRRFTDTLMDNSRRFRQLSLAYRTDHEKIIDEHAAILRACVEGDAEAAADHHRAHLELTREAIRTWAAES